jgi:G:T-mismatch repair DNA endonuclease (very short patch repair protein)
MAYWSAKIARNRRHDRRIRRIARARGYTVLRVWECELRSQPARCIARITRAYYAAAVGTIRPIRRGSHIQGHRATSRDSMSRGLKDLETSFGQA